MSSYGWLFPVISAFGLLLFLTVSFALYRRRLVVRRRKMADYNQFLRYLRPDLEVNNEKTPRSRLNITTSINCVEPLSKRTDYNSEAFEDGTYAGPTANGKRDSNKDTNVSYPKTFINHSNNNVENQSSVQEIDTSLRGKTEPNFQIGEFITSVTDTNKQVKVLSKDVDIKEHLVQVNYLDECKDFIPENLTKITEKGKKPVPETEHISTQHNDMVNVLPVLLKSKPNTSSKKKKHGLLSRISKRRSSNLLNDRIDKCMHYSESGRCTDPSLLLYNEGTVIPENKRRTKSRNERSYGTCFTDINGIQRGPVPIVENENEIGV